jgi:pimeloyl-ACP methyl ester carboxylesterase
VLDDAGVAAADVVTGSAGCTVAIHFALAWPQRVRALMLCWPGSSDNVGLRADFERTALEVAALGPAVYLERLEEPRPPRPGEPRPGFPFGFALLRDERAARSFRACTPEQAAFVMRESAARLLTDGPLRGVSESDADALGRALATITVLPVDPDDLFQTRVAAKLLVGAIPGARLSSGTPVSPSPHFSAQRTRFLKLLREAFALG